MEENIQYEIQIDRIKENYITPKGTIQHNTGSFFKLLPYVTTKSKQMLEFNGVFGAFSRIICGKELKSEINISDLIENIVDIVGEFDRTTSKDSFRYIINNIYINKNGKLVNFNLTTINYITASNDDINFAEFLYSILFDERLKGIVQEHYNKTEKNILNKLVLSALPGLKDKTYNVRKYRCYLPFVKEIFKEDFYFLIQHEELYKSSLKRFLEYYYMFYVSQLCMKLNQFEKADLTKPEILYYTLGWESISQNRTAYKFGLDFLCSKVSNIFSHAVILDFFNCVNFEEKFTYSELFDLFNKMDDDEINNSKIRELYDVYLETINDVIWTENKFVNRNSGNKAFDILLNLFSAVDYQFNNSSRNDPYKNYRNKFINFINKSFGKRRGSLGYSLNLNEEDIILLTKLCINNRKKLKLNCLFDEFKRRGISFDMDSRSKIIQLYEKLNLLEKKSDSGDAQYVRSIL